MEFSDSLLTLVMDRAIIQLWPVAGERTFSILKPIVLKMLTGPAVPPLFLSPFIGFTGVGVCTGEDCLYITLSHV